jgi:hypothetical protein
LTGEITAVDPNDFLVEVDAHETAIEAEFQEIEGPASRAAHRLAKLVRHYPTGLYAIVDEGAEPQLTGPDLVEVGARDGMRLFVSQKVLPSPPEADRLALARFVFLVYQRAPKHEAMMAELRQAYELGAQRAFDRLMPGRRVDLDELLGSRRARMVSLANETADDLAAARWWIARAPDDRPFILGDCPVVTTPSLGHDGGWEAILSERSGAVILPLGPLVALIIAPHGAMPTSIEASQVPDAVNRLTWRWADRFVVARTRGHLEPFVADDDTLRSVGVVADLRFDELVLQSESLTEGIIFDAHVTLSYRRAVQLPFWRSCRLVDSRFPWSAADRDWFVGSFLLPPPCVVSPASPRRRHPRS